MHPSPLSFDEVSFRNNSTLYLLTTLFLKDFKVVV
jgi:hypothetical protein